MAVALCGSDGEGLRRRRRSGQASSRLFEWPPVLEAAGLAVAATEAAAMGLDGLATEEAAAALGLAAALAVMSAGVAVR